MISFIHSMTASSTWVDDWSKPPALAFIAAARNSANTALGTPLPITQPQKRGWMLPTE